MNVLRSSLALVALQTSSAAESGVELLVLFLYLPNVDGIDLCPVLHSAGDQTPYSMPTGQAAYQLIYLPGH